MANQISVKPFLKWPGGKRIIAERILSELPEARRIIEPFCGSCAVTLASKYPRQTLADINPDLINLYQHLQTEGESFIDYCAQFFSPASTMTRRRDYTTITSGITIQRQGDILRVTRLG